MAALFTAEHIGKSFHLRPVLRDVSFSLAVGETILLIGRNGSGKTTLLRILAGLMRPETGQASLDGQPLFTPDGRWRGDMVYLGHRANLYPDFTARENLMLDARLRNRPWGDERFMSLMQRHGLGGREGEPVRVYSEGMLQRLGLIRLQLSTWKVAFLDEPSSALDVEGTELLAETVAGWRAAGRTVLFTSHRLEWGADQASRVLLLAGGVIREELADPRPSQLATMLKA